MTQNSGSVSPSVVLCCLFVDTLFIPCCYLVCHCHSFVSQTFLHKTTLLTIVVNTCVLKEANAEGPTSCLTAPLDLLPPPSPLPSSSPLGTPPLGQRGCLVSGRPDCQSLPSGFKVRQTGRRMAPLGGQRLGRAALNSVGPCDPGALRRHGGHVANAPRL